MSELNFLPGSVEQMRIGDLHPYARNPRTHSDDQVAKVAASIVEFGWTVPVLVDDAGEIIAGHGRVLAARQLGLADVPVIRLSHLTPEQVRAYRIADNKLTELSGWDEAVLAAEFCELDAVGYDLGLTGFGEEELAALLAPIDDDAGAERDGSVTLAERFGIPPLSVLNAREGWWQDRKRAWIDLGIKSELGRGGG